MPGITTLFRQCPSCGRRFEIGFVGKSLVSKERDSCSTTRAGYGYIYPAQRRGYGNVMGSTPFQSGGVGWEFVELEEKVRVTVERKRFQYAYKCKHCGRQWIEKRTEEAQPLLEKRRN